MFEDGAYEAELLWDYEKILSGEGGNCVSVFDSFAPEFRGVERKFRELERSVVVSSSSSESSWESCEIEAWLAVDADELVRKLKVREKG